MDTGNNMDESEIICKNKPVSKCNILNIYIFSAFFSKSVLSREKTDLQLPESGVKEGVVCKGAPGNFGE